MLQCIACLASQRESPFECRCRRDLHKTRVLMAVATRCTLHALHLGIRNGGGKHGRGNQPPYRRYGPDTEIQYRPRKLHMDLQNPAELSPKGKAMRNFSIDPTPLIRTRLRTPFLQTPFPRLLLHTDHQHPCEKNCCTVILWGNYI